jgi:hypothetical protein
MVRRKLDDEEIIDYEAALKNAEKQKKAIQAEIAKLNKELEDANAALKFLEEQGKQGENDVTTAI